ncbi:MAG TPA: hypothetical protein VIL09_07145 [Microvirga sp.]|jgi:hypothetical protein
MIDEVTIRVAERLERVRVTLGDQVFQDAASRALVAIASAVQAEAERRAARKNPGTATCPSVIPFPPGGRRTGRPRGGRR